MNPIVEAQLVLLRKAYPSADVRSMQDGSFLLSISAIPLPSGWNRTQTSVWFVIPIGYPVAKPDCFWADQDLRLADGRQPMNTNIQAMPNQEMKLWFSWHTQKWNPNADSLLTYIHVVEGRLKVIQ
jgi:hypothetical protein